MQPRVHEVAPAADLRLDVCRWVVAVEIGQEVVIHDPVRFAIRVDHRGKVQRDHAGQLLVGHLDGMLDPVVERIGPGRAERRLECIEDEFLRRGAHAVDRDLPAGLVRPADRGGELRRLPVHDRARAIVQVDLQTLDAEAVIDEARLPIGVPVSEELLVEVEREVGVDAKRQGVVGGKGLELVDALLVDPLFGDGCPAARHGQVHGFGRRTHSVVSRGHRSSERERR